MRDEASVAFLASIGQLDAKMVRTVLTTLDGQTFEDPEPMRSVLERAIPEIIQAQRPWRDVLLQFLHSRPSQRPQPPAAA